MFYSGDLSSGINQALSESKVVACFVTNHNEESQLWENDFLNDPELKRHMQNNAITLRLEAGSQEANYLAAVFPIPKVPTLVLIKNGELKEYIASGATKDDFTSRLDRALKLGDAVDNGRASGSVEVTDPAVSERRTARGASDSSGAPTSSAPLSESSGVLSSDPTDSGVVTEHALPQQPPQGSPRPSRGTSYAGAQRKLQQDAKEERERVRKLVEGDKIARKVREVERKVNAGGAGTEKSTPPNKESTSSKSQDCALQIRLFDGSTIRSRFPSNSTLNKEVRQWIDEQRTDAAPFVFKQILSPLPNRNISMTEETMDVKSLGLMPSATLILVPVHDYVSSYEGSHTSGLLWRGISEGYRVGSWGLNQILGPLRNIVYGPATNPIDSSPATTTTNTTATPATNLRTLRDRNRDTDDHQLYNGNTLNFEPRKDEPSDEN